MKLVRVNDDIVVEIISLAAGFSLEETFHPDVVAGIFEAPDNVELGWWRNGSSFSPPQLPKVDLAALRTSLKEQIDCQAETERLKYITPGAGQAMTYARKVEQAKAAQADADPEPDDYPLLKASIGIDGDDVKAVATTILAMDAAWEQIGAAIEAARLGAKKAIDVVETAEAAEAVRPEWPTP